jgi:hypothetical protein
MAARDQAESHPAASHAQPDLSIPTPAQLRRVGFSHHAIERFAERAGLSVRTRAAVEPIIRDLLRQEGLLSTQPPRWARTSDPGELYLQIGEWMAFILRRDARRVGHYTAVTAINGPPENTWTHALTRGYLATPPAPELHPLQRRPTLRDTIAAVLAERRCGGDQSILLLHLLHAHRERRAEARRKRDRVHALNREMLKAHQEARDRARQFHARRYPTALSEPRRR